MKAFLTPLQGLAEFEQIKEKSKTNKGILQVSGCMESQKSHLMYGPVSYTHLTLPTILRV